MPRYSRKRPWDSARRNRSERQHHGGPDGNSGQQRQQGRGTRKRTGQGCGHVVRITQEAGHTRHNDLRQFAHYRVNHPNGHNTGQDPPNRDRGVAETPAFPIEGRDNEQPVAGAAIESRRDRPQGLFAQRGVNLAIETMGRSGVHVSPIPSRRSSSVASARGASTSSACPAGFPTTRRFPRRASRVGNRG